MTGDIYGPDLVIVFFVLVVALVGLVIPIWAIVDAASRPT